MSRALLLLLLLSAPAAAGSPAETLRVCHADAAGLPGVLRLRSRWLSQYPDAANPEALLRYDRVLHYWLNALVSTHPEIVRLTRVRPWLWRVDLAEAGWKAEVWERLLDAEPWWHVKILAEARAAGAVAGVPVSSGVEAAPPPFVLPAGAVVRKFRVRGETEWQEEYSLPNEPALWDGRRFAVRWRPVPRQQVRAVQTAPQKVATAAAAAPWLDAKLVAELVLWTQSQVPIVRADWWLFQTAQQRGRNAGYYDFLGVGRKEADFLRLGRADFKVSEELRKLHRANVARSGVALNARGLKGSASLTEGVAFLTEDYLKTIDDKNALRLLEGDARPDGGEGFITLPNGLFGVWIQNANGERVDSVPTAIATDGKAPGVERDIDVGLDCFRCHRTGLQPIGDWARRVYHTPFKLESPDFQTQKRLRAAYLSDLEKFVRRGNEVYAEALLKVNGLTPQKNADELAWAWERYVEHDRDIDAAAAEFGVTGAVLLDALKAEAARGERGGKKLDPILASLLQGLSVRHEHLEELVPEVYRILGAK